MKAKVRGAAVFAVPLLVFMLASQWLTGTICVFSAAFGIPCPGCGLTRAWVLALRGQWAEAFFFHPLFWYIPVIALVWGLGWLRNRRQTPRWLGVFLKASFALFVAVFALRMALYFPRTAPMVPNRDSFAWRIGRGIWWVVRMILR
ncbi:MAG: DUF2752 domain-containing protein [Oscillospiraceae bacterium]|nr:DUF2752 domain-containing protein [Oscillospiraceae bacterium]